MANMVKDETYTGQKDGTSPTSEKRSKEASRESKRCDACKWVLSRPEN